MKELLTCVSEFWKEDSTENYLRAISEVSVHGKPVKHFSAAQPITQLSANIISGPEVIQASAIPEPLLLVHYTPQTLGL